MSNELTEMLRARVSRRLAARLQCYIAKEEERGRTLKDSDVVRDAVLEYLDKRDVPVAPWTDKPKEPPGVRAPRGVADDTKPIKRPARPAIEPDTEGSA